MGKEERKKLTLNALGRVSPRWGQLSTTTVRCGALQLLYPPASNFFNPKKNWTFGKPLVLEERNPRRLKKGTKTAQKIHRATGR